MRRTGPAYSFQAGYKFFKKLRHIGDRFEINGAKGASLPAELLALVAPHVALICAALRTAFIVALRLAPTVRTRRSLLTSAALYALLVDCADGRSSSSRSRSGDAPGLVFRALLQH